MLRSLTQETSAQRVLASRPTSPVLTMTDRRPSSSSHGRKSRVPSMSPAPGSLHENVTATLSPASGLTSRSARSSSELERSTLDLTQGREESTSSPVMKWRSGQNQKQWGQFPRDASESNVSSSDQGNDSELSESATGTDASGSHILSGSVMFHKPTIGKHHADNVASHHANTQMDVPFAPAKRAVREPGASILTKNSPDTQSQDMQQSDSSTLGGLMKVGAVPIQRASGFLYNSGKRVSGLFGSTPSEYYDKFSGMIAGGKKHYAEADELQPGEEVQDSEDEMTVREAEKSFRNHFALPDSEKLVATFFGFFHRVLPLYGKLYVGSTRLCFRSFMPGNWTKVSSRVVLHTLPLLTSPSSLFRSRISWMWIRKEASVSGTPAWLL